MDTPDGLSRRSVAEKSGMDVKFFDEGNLLNVGEDENHKVGNDEDVELDVIDVSQCDKRNGLRLVSEDYRLEVLRRHHDSQVTGHWGRHRTQELVSHNFTWDR